MTMPTLKDLEAEALAIWSSTQLLVFSGYRVEFRPNHMAQPLVRCSTPGGWIRDYPGATWVDALTQAVNDLLPEENGR